MSVPVVKHGSTNTNPRTSIEIVQIQGKRGPGRPRKNKVNGKIKVGKDRSRSKNRKIVSATVPHLTKCMKVSDTFIPTFPGQNDWLRKRKKLKKKDVKEKNSNPELLKDIEDLTGFFTNKCSIEDKKLSLMEVNLQHHSTNTR